MFVIIDKQFSKKDLVSHVTENKSVWTKQYKTTIGEICSLVEIEWALTTEDVKCLIYFDFFSKDRFIRETIPEVDSEMFWNGYDRKKAVLRVTVSHYEKLFRMYLNFGVCIMDATRWILELIPQHELNYLNENKIFSNPWHYEYLH